jgi:hypothetical protein
MVLIGVDVRGVSQIEPTEVFDHLVKKRRGNKAAAALLTSTPSPSSAGGRVWCRVF